MNYDTIKEEIKDIDITLPPPQEEPERQYYFIKKLQHWMELKKEEKGRELTCCVNTFGCQMNARDSEKIIGILMTIGYKVVEDEDADLVIFNTCTVRENANLKVYCRLGQFNLVCHLYYSFISTF